MTPGNFLCPPPRLRSRTCFSRLLTALALACGTAVAADDGQGFVSIFDGKTLDGWEQASGNRIPNGYGGGEWRVEDGAIVGEQEPVGVGGLLLTEKDYGDFELEIDIDPDWGCDSGIYLRTNESGQSLQVYVDYIHGGNIGFLYGQGLLGFSSKPWHLLPVREGGSLVGVRAEDRYDGVEIDGLIYSATADDFNRAWKHGEYNTLKIRIAGSEPLITTWINGVKMMEMDGTTFRARNLIDVRDNDLDAASIWNAAEVERSLGVRGRIGLQVHPEERWSGAVRFKNIRIKELD